MAGRFDDILREAGVDYSSAASRIASEPTQAPGPYRANQRPGAELPAWTPPRATPGQQRGMRAFERAGTLQREPDPEGFAPWQRSGMTALELTGLPAFRRAGQAGARGDVGGAALETGMGALGVAGLMVAPGAARGMLAAPRRAAPSITPPRYGANDRGALERGMAAANRETDFATWTRPGGINTELYPERLWNSNEPVQRVPTWARAEGPRHGHMAGNRNLTPEEQAQLDSMPPLERARMLSESDPNALSAYERSLLAQMDVSDRASLMMDSLPPLTPAEQAWQARVRDPATPPEEVERMWAELRRSHLPPESRARERWNMDPNDPILRGSPDPLADPATQLRGAAMRPRGPMRAQTAGNEDRRWPMFGTPESTRVPRAIQPQTRASDGMQGLEEIPVFRGGDDGRPMRASRHDMIYGSAVYTTTDQAGAAGYGAVGQYTGRGRLAQATDWRRAQTQAAREAGVELPPIEGGGAQNPVINRRAREILINDGYAGVQDGNVRAYFDIDSVRPLANPEAAPPMGRAIQPQTRTPDGRSILPQATPRPFRRTEARSEDLREAAMQPPQQISSGAREMGNLGKPWRPRNRNESPVRFYFGEDPAMSYGDGDAWKAIHQRIQARDWEMQDVRLDDLTAGGQDIIDPGFRRVPQPNGYSNEPPIIIRHRGRMYIEDGNHRLTALAERGTPSARVAVIDMDKNRPAPVPPRGPGRRK